MSNGLKAVLVVIVAVAITIFFGAVLAVASEDIPERHEERTKEKRKMRKIEKVITAIVIAFAVMAALMVTAGAEERNIEKQFVFGRYAPVVAIHHPVYNWVLESRPLCNQGIQSRGLHSEIPDIYTERIQDGRSGDRQIRDGNGQRYAGI